MNLLMTERLVSLFPSLLQTVLRRPLLRFTRQALLDNLGIGLNTTFRRLAITQEWLFYDYHIHSCYLAELEDEDDVSLSG